MKIAVSLAYQKISILFSFFTRSIYSSYKNLEKSGINHLISDSYLDQHFLSSIDKICYGLSKWYTQKPIEKIVEYDGLNLGEFFYTENHKKTNILKENFLKNFNENCIDIRFIRVDWKSAS